MRLLHYSARGELNLTKNLQEDVPRYAILSHTWGAEVDEVTFQDLENGSDKSKVGFSKIQFCGGQAQKDGLQYFWVDTCCIDKANHTELSEAITSMFRWYRNSTKCYVYLSDVSARKRDQSGHTHQLWEPAFRKSKWFTRGWTLQELLAPKSVEFFSREGELLGEKKVLEQQIHEITGIPLAALRGVPLSTFSVDERLKWVGTRQTKKKEDEAYCLMGIFDVFMPLMYGEGKHAFARLKEGMYETKLDEATIKSIDDMKVSDPVEDMKRIEQSQDVLLKDCCKWIFEDPSFIAWRNTKDNQLLWISGDPGKGKTMLMIASIRELLNDVHGNSSAVTFFFCQSTNIQRNSAASILRGLIWKLANDHPRLAKHIPDKYQSDKRSIDNPNAIISFFSILSAMVDDCPRTFLLIDALDECSSGVERDQLLDLITGYARSSSKAKWLLSSRNDPKIGLLLRSESQILSLELNKHYIYEGVCTFIEQKINELAAQMKYNQVLKEKVNIRLRDKANSTFLWVALICKRLRNVRPGKVLSTLENLPLGLEDLYTQSIENIFQVEDGKNRDFCLRILRSTSLAFRPLSTEELINVAGLPTELLAKDSLSELTELCGSFIIIRQDIIYFVHQSAKDYLVGEGAPKLFPTGFKNDHGLIVRFSLNALSRTLRKDMCDLRDLGSSPNEATVHTFFKAIGYACSFWVDHLISFLRDDSNDSMRHQKFLLNEARVYGFLLKHFLHWFEALSLIREANRGILGLQSLEWILKRLTTQQSEIFLLKDFVYDAIRVMRQFRQTVEEAPLQVYCSTLLFSPEQSLIRQNFKQEVACWIYPFPRIPKTWNSCLQTLEGHTRSIYSVVFSPSGQQLASGSGDRTVWLWDAATGADQQTLEGHTDLVSSVTFSPDGQKLASGSGDRTLRLWDVATGACLQTLEGHTDWITSVVFSPDGQQLASGSRDHTLRLWDAATGACRNELMGHSGSVSSVTFSPNGQQLASGSDDSTVRLWDAATGAGRQTLEGHTGSVYSVVFSPNGQQLASGSGDYTLRLWDTATGAARQTLEGHTGSVSSVTFSPNGQQLASGSGDSTLRLWDLAIGADQQTLEGHTDLVSSVTFSPDGQKLASGSGDRTLRLWDVATGACLQTLEGHTDWITSVVFSPDCGQLASGSRDHTLRLWDAVTGVCMQILRGHTGSVNSIMFSPNGKQLASRSSDNTQRLWDASTGACQRKLESRTSWVVFDSDGSSFVADFAVLSAEQTEFSIRSNKWVTWNGRNILWLPAEYRAHKFSAKENRIGVGCSSGLVYILNFHPDNIPSKRQLVRMGI